MTQCNVCGSQLPVGVAYCPACGAMTPYNVSASGVSPYDPTRASSALDTPQQPPLIGDGSPHYGAPQQNPYEPVNPYAVPLRTPPPLPPRRQVKISLLIGVGVLVLLLASVWVVASWLIQPSQKSMHGITTSTTVAAPSTTTVTTAQNPYPPYHGTLAFNDPLSDNSHGNGWTEGGSGSSGTCQFKEGAYHISESDTQSVRFCTAASTDFSTFAYEVQMTIIKGEGGGIMFRADNINGKFYYFFVSSDGSYNLLLYADYTHVKVLIQNLTSAIKQGLNQVNLIAVEANGNTITLYINHQQIVSVKDGTYSHGQIGLVANPYVTNGHPTEVAFSNAKVWTLV